VNYLFTFSASNHPNSLLLFGYGTANHPVLLIYRDYIAYNYKFDCWRSKLTVLLYCAEAQLLLHLYHQYVTCTGQTRFDLKQIIISVLRWCTYLSQRCSIIGLMFMHDLLISYLHLLKSPVKNNLIKIKMDAWISTALIINTITPCLTLAWCHSFLQLIHSTILCNVFFFLNVIQHPVLQLGLPRSPLATCQDA
jgi:hypothetical protein